MTSGSLSSVVALVLAVEAEAGAAPALEAVEAAGAVLDDMAAGVAIVVVAAIDVVAPQCELFGLAEARPPSIRPRRVDRGEARFNRLAAGLAQRRSNDAGDDEAGEQEELSIQWSSVEQC